MRGVAIALALGLLFLTSDAYAQPGDPPFEVPFHTLSENGIYSIVVVYHQNGTYDLQVGDMIGRMESLRLRATGYWWRGHDGAFCFRPDPPARDAGKTHCKPAGLLIGRSSAPLTPQ